MAKLIITEFSGADHRWPIANFPPITSQILNFSSSAVSAVLDSRTNFVQLRSNTDVWITLGEDPTASVGGDQMLPLPANETYEYMVPHSANRKIAVTVDA